MPGATLTVRSPIRSTKMHDHALNRWRNFPPVHGDPDFLNVCMSVKDCQCTSSIDLRAVAKFQWAGIFTDTESAVLRCSDVVCNIQTRRIKTLPETSPWLNNLHSVSFQRCLVLAPTCFLPGSGMSSLQRLPPADRHLGTHRKKGGCQGPLWVVWRPSSCAAELILKVWAWGQNPRQPSH